MLCENDSISLTYSANCGFLIEMDSKKIIVDGLFRFGHNRYSTPDTSTQRLLVSNQYPFDNINLQFFNISGKYPIFYS
jgi:L-ascorbate metabolism protein UlaG (beta-lactamase superfamily)